ncbi:MAG: hypothetical protein FWC50_15085 [Planctomycetaceae bacterium]|nr:hypothetical protein [Planctomycetaceae bacterium]
MGLFGKKKPKGPKKITDRNHGLKDQIEGELLPAELGLEPDEIERLLELLGRDNERRIVWRRKVGSILDAAKGIVLWLKPYRLTLKEAQAVTHKLAEERRERDALLLKKILKKNPDYKLPEQVNPDDIEYPKKLSPDDVVNAMEAARKRLEPLPRPVKSKVSENRAKQIFSALEQLKNEEATRFARKVASLQHRHLEGDDLVEEGNSGESSTNGATGESTRDLSTGNTGDIWEQYGLDEKEIERIRTLQGFGKHAPKTLVDNAGELINENIDTAAKIVKQWIGNTNRET